MRFGVLGPLTVWTADGEPVAIPELKVRALLVGLLTDPGHVVSADRLVEFLWDGEPPAKPAAAIQTRVSRLRRAVGADLIERRAPGYRLAVAATAVDSGRFTALVAEARASSEARTRRDLLSEALGLWRGEAFADFTDALFVRPTITRLSQQRLVAVEELAEARLELGEAAAVAAELGEQVGAQPRRERLRAIHMRALYQSGRQAEALDGYHELRRHLSDELGLDPAPELTELYGRMLRQEPATRFTDTTEPASGEDRAGDDPRTALAADGRPRDRNGARSVGGAAIADSVPSTNEHDRVAAAASGAGPWATGGQQTGRDTAAQAHASTLASDAAARGNLPRPLTELIGRDTDLAELRPLLRGHRLVTLTGMGGVGKTSLAIAAARDGATDTADGTWLVELAAQPETATTAQLAEVVAATLGLRDDQPQAAPQRVGDPVARLAEALHGKHSRLLLDNCEHLVAAVAELAEALLRTVPRLSILATSQEPLGITGEQLVAVGPLRPDAAVELFTARARGAAPGFTVTDAATLAAICDRLDGIPLALELAANRVRVLGLNELAQRLADRFGVLTGGRRDAPARQRTLRAMLDWSWDLLTAAERIVLRRLAVHAEGCTLAAAEATCATDGVRPAEVLDLLARLVDRSLVNVTHDGDGPRYRLLESVAAYCGEQLRAAADHTPARRSHAAYYTDLTERLDARLRGPDQDQALRILDAESANIRFAFDTLVTAPADQALARPGLADSARAIPASGRGQVAAPVPADSGLDAGRDIDSDGPGLADSAPAIAADGRARSAEAAIDSDAALRLVIALSWYWFLRGRLAEPKRMLARVLAVPDPGGSRYAQAVVLRYTVRLLAGDTDLVIEEFTADADRMFDRITDPGRRARAQWFLSHALTYFGDSELPERLLEPATATFAELEDCWGHAAVTYSQAEFRYDRGELAVAHEQASRGLELFVEAGDRWGQSQAGTLLGRLAEVAGDYPRAVEHHRAALGLAEQLGLWSAVSIGNSELGRIALLTGDLDRAEQQHAYARRIAVEHADQPSLEYAELGLALGARRQHKLDEADRFLRKWLDWNRELDTDFGLALILAELGFVAELRGDAEAALRLQRDGMLAAKRTGNPRAVALALEGLAGARSVAGAHAPAARLLGAAAALRDSLAAPLPPAERGDVDRIDARLREALGENRFAELLAEGSTMDVGALDAPVG